MPTNHKPIRIEELTTPTNTINHEEIFKKLRRAKRKVKRSGIVDKDT